MLYDVKQLNCKQRFRSEILPQLITPGNIYTNSYKSLASLHHFIGNYVGGFDCMENVLMAKGLVKEEASRVPT